jgi:hypothetical protein
LFPFKTTEILTTFGKTRPYPWLARFKYARRRAAVCGLMASASRRPPLRITRKLPRAKARHRNGEIEVVPVVLYLMDLKHDCEFLYQLNPLPAWGKSCRDFEKNGDWNDALYPIGEGVKQAIEKARLR